MKEGWSRKEGGKGGRKNVGMQINEREGRKREQDDR